MITTVASPFLSAAPSLSSTVSQTAAQAPVAEPQDVVLASGGNVAAAESTHELGAMGKATVGLMLGATVLGAGVLPARAEAHEMRNEIAVSRPVRYEGFHGGYRGGYGGGDAGAVIGGVILGGILGGIIGGALPPPIMIPTPMPMPVPMPMPGPVVVNPGYNGMGCDGVMHHFDGYGNVSDATGNYRLGQNQWGQCVRTAPVYSPYGPVYAPPVMY